MAFLLIPEPCNDVGIDRSEVMMASGPEGVDKVEQSNGMYAFFMESSGIAYLVERRCKLSQVHTRSPP